MELDVIVVTHGGLAVAFREAVQLIMGPQPQLTTIGFFEGDDPAKIANRISAQIHKSSADFHIIFSDLFGATPSNIALMAVSQCENAAVVTGINLISLIEALSLNGEVIDCQSALKRIEKEGRQGVRVLTKELLQQQRLTSSTEKAGQST